MNLRHHTLALTPGSIIAHGFTLDCEQGDDAIPCITLDDFTVTVPDDATLHKLLGEVARLGVVMNECAWKPCGTLDCCEYGAVDCVSRDLVVTGEPT